MCVYRLDNILSVCCRALKTARARSTFHCWHLWLHAISVQTKDQLQDSLSLVPTAIQCIHLLLPRTKIIYINDKVQRKINNAKKTLIQLFILQIDMIMVLLALTLRTIYGLRKPCVAFIFNATEYYLIEIVIFRSSI